MKLEQLYVLPGVGQLAVCCALSLLVHGGADADEEEWGREREGGSERHLGVQVCS